MQNELYLTFIQGRIYGGKYVTKDLNIENEELQEAVEFIVGMSGQSQVSVLGFKVGDIILPKERVLIRITKDSVYYPAYLQISSNIVPGGRLNV